MTHTIPKRISDRIRWARLRKGISQERLAGLVGTSRRHVIRWEKGVVPRQEYRQRLAVALDQPDDFFSVDDDEEAEPEVVVDVLIAALMALKGQTDAASAASVLRGVA